MEGSLRRMGTSTCLPVQDPEQWLDGQHTQPSSYLPEELELIVSGPGSKVISRAGEPEPVVFYP